MAASASSSSVERENTTLHGLGLSALDHPMSSLAFEEIVRLPPMIFGKIRWKKSMGRPRGNPCSAFDIQVDEHTATEFVDIGGGKYDDKPGTGIWKTVEGSVVCKGLSEEGDYHALRFQVTGLHYNAYLDGHYRVTPRLTGVWGASGLFSLLSGFRLIEPLSDTAMLTKAAPVATREFEVFRRSWFSGRRLG
jgi:hypothetical protein